MRWIKDSMTEKKTKTVAIRMDPEMYGDIREIADYNGLAVSQLIRRLLKKALDDMNVEEDLIYETIQRI